MKVAEVKELNQQELVERIAAQEALLTQTKINHAISPVDSPASIKAIRRDIARMKTVLRQRELTQQ